MTANADSLTAKAAAGGRWTAISAVASVVIQFAQLAILGRLLSPEDFGLMAMMMVVIGLASTLADFGLSNYIVRARSLAERQFTSLLLIACGFAGLLASAVVASATWVSAYFKTPMLMELLPVLGVVVVLSAATQIGTALLQRAMRFRALALAELISGLAGLVAGVLCAFAELGIWSLIAAQLTVAVFKPVLCWGYARDLVIFHRPVWSAELAAGLRFGAFQTGERLLNFAGWNVDKAIIGRMLGEGGLGIYSVAYQLVLRPFSILNPIFTRVALPVFASVQDDDQRLQRGYLQMLRTIALLSFPVYLVIMVAADSLILFLLGSQWNEAGSVLQVLSILGFVFSLGNPIGSLLLAKGRADLGFYYNVIALLVYAIAIYIGSGYGVIGVAIGFVAAAACLLFPLEFLLRWMLIRMSVSEYLRALGPLLAAILVPITLVSIYRSFMPGFSRGSDLIEAFIALSVFLAVVWLTERGLVRATLQLLHSR